MATLRKSCRNCAAAKRHCTVQLPSCGRCVQKGLTCTYDLLPFGGSGDPDKCSASQLLADPGFNTAGYCLLVRAEAHSKTFGNGLDPAFCPPGHQEGKELISQCFIQVPELVVSLRPAVFIHPELRLQTGQPHLSPIKGPPDSVISYNELQKLADMDITAVSLGEKLTALQALLVLTAPLLISETPGEQASAEPWLKTAEEWAHHMLNVASAELLDGRTPWQQWLFAESIRRTIIMAYVLICCFNGWKYGYCSNWLLLESLAFDGRPGLWMATSPQAWIAAAGAKTGNNVGTELSSLHEFGGKMKDVDSTFCGDIFLSMVAMAHNGSAALPKNSD